METIDTRPIVKPETPTSETEITDPQTLTALDLNNIRLDPNHTILTPEYLEKKK